MTKTTDANPVHPALKPATRLVVGGRDRVLRLQELLVEHVGLVRVRVDLRREPAGLGRLRCEIALGSGARGAGEGHRPEGQTERKAQGQVTGPKYPTTAVGASAPPRHGHRL